MYQLRSFYFLIEKNTHSETLHRKLKQKEQPTKFWLNEKQKKRWNYKSLLKYIRNLVKTYLSNWLVEYNGDLIFICNFFSLNLNNNDFFLRLLSHCGHQRKQTTIPKKKITTKHQPKHKQPLTTQRAKMIFFFSTQKRIHLYFLTLIVILFHERPKTKMWLLWTGREREKEIAGTRWSDWNVKQNRKWTESNSWLAKTFQI